MERAIFFMGRDAAGFDCPVDDARAMLRSSANKLLIQNYEYERSESSSVSDARGEKIRERRTTNATSPLTCSVVSTAIIIIYPKFSHPLLRMEKLLASTSIIKHTSNERDATSATATATATALAWNQHQQQQPL
jgi:hypothetical protein